MRTLLEEYVPRVYRFALRLTSDCHTAEDLTQETFLRAWQQRDRVRHPEAVRVWLFRIATNLWRDQLRRKKSLVAQAGPLSDEEAGQTRAPDHQMAEQDDVRRALTALDTLPPRQREVLYLSACEELSAAEIASVLEVSLDSVKVNLCLARKKLREQLKDLVEGAT